MSRATVTIRTAADRAQVVDWAGKVPVGTRVEFKASKRSADQNSKMWACLTDVSRQVEWHGQHLSPQDWKDVFTASLRKGRAVPGIDDGSIVVLGLHTSDMSKDEMSDLIELIMAFGAQHDVQFGDGEERAA